MLGKGYNVFLIELVEDEHFFLDMCLCFDVIGVKRLDFLLEESQASIHLPLVCLLEFSQFSFSRVFQGTKIIFGVLAVC